MILPPFAESFFAETLVPQVSPSPVLASMSPVPRTMFSALILFAAPFVIATSINSRHNDHHDVSARLPSTWYHAAEHPVHKLFKRGPEDTDGVEYATVGSPSKHALQ